MSLRQVDVDGYTIYGVSFPSGGKFLPVGTAYGYMLRHGRVPYITVTFRVPKRSDTVTLPSMDGVHITVQPTTRGNRVVCEFSGRSITELVKEVAQAVSTAEIDRLMGPIRELARQASLTTQA